ncbi:glutathione S-transferase family protein [Vibrio sonorensis]|uniref:glutathione S-transferase family protein n=1 Tax=Vibrio sonorensis TaxID=1004316 RepID=UPI000AE116FB|nr:glutathione S-transferase N-terminal domain-containing protein [Vibrio sonorensis]
MIKLYWHPLSGHAHRVHMLLSFLNLEYELVTVDLPAGEHRQAEFLALNPFGQVPVLVDGDTVIADSNAILVYLASVYDDQNTWLPNSPVLRANVEQFLSLAAHRIAGSIAKLRAATYLIVQLRMNHWLVKLIKYLVSSTAIWLAKSGWLQQIQLLPTSPCTVTSSSHLKVA